jgi:hypothetical protein
MPCWASLGVLPSAADCRRSKSAALGLTSLRRERQPGPSDRQQSRQTTSEGLRPRTPRSCAVDACAGRAGTESEVGETPQLAVAGDRLRRCGPQMSIRDAKGQLISLQREGEEPHLAVRFGVRDAVVSDTLVSLKVCC